MRIAVLTPTFSAFSGIDRLVELQAEKLVKEGHVVDIFALEGSLSYKHGKLVTLGMPASGFFQRLYRLFMFLDKGKVQRYAKEIATYDKVISHLYPMTIFAAAAKKINPSLEYVYHNEGVGIVDSYSFFERLYLKLFNAFNNRYVRRCDKAVSISKFLQGVLQDETGISSTVEYVPIDTSRFHLGIFGGRVRKKYGIKDGKVLLYVGRVSPHKGVHLLISAFKEVQKTFTDAKLIIVGKPTFPSYSKKLAKMANEGVVFAGFVSDEELPAFYAACDVYATCTLWEGFDIPIKEAEACGKPTVAFDIGAHPEVLMKGKLVPAKDLNAFGEAVVEILKK